MADLGDWHPTESQHTASAAYVSEIMDHVSHMLRLHAEVDLVCLWFSFTRSHVKMWPTIVQKLRSEAEYDIQNTGSSVKSRLDRMEALVAASL